MQKENQRVVISKRLLKEALLRLLEKKHIDEISVSELCQASEINRTTFYRHYQTPHDVLLEMEFDFVSRFYDTPGTTNDWNDMWKTAVRMCHFIYDDKETVKLFMRNNTDSDFTQIFQNFSDGFLASRKVLYKDKAVDADMLRLMATFFAHGIYALIRQWIMEDIPKTPEEIAELVVSSFSRDYTFK